MANGWDIVFYIVRDDSSHNQLILSRLPIWLMSLCPKTDIPGMESFPTEIPIEGGQKFLNTKLITIYTVSNRFERRDPLESESSI
jgi:hypothetical protein